MDNISTGKLAHPANLGKQKSVDDTISMDRLEKFVNRTFHWKSLPASDQMKMAKELLRRRRESGGDY